MNQIIYEFIATYSRYEYVLKRLKYAEMRRRSIFTCRDKYLKENLCAILADSSPDIKEARQYYLDHPPLKQVISKDGNLQFVPVECTRDEEWIHLYNLVDCVRNNLFHGGKAMEPENCERNLKLMEYGTVLIRHAIKINDKAKSEFNELLNFDLRSIS